LARPGTRGTARALSGVLERVSGVLEWD
jgi:hypothetical protein